MSKTLRKFFLLMALLVWACNGFAQNVTITGQVTDDQKSPIIGASVVLLGTTVGNATDVDGNYQINKAPAGKFTIKASSLGFKSVTKEINLVNNQTITVNFVLAADVMNMEEMVIVGYGTNRKRNITSSISSIKAAELANISVPSFEAALQGRSSGVQVTSDNGLAGAPVTLRIRGTSSLSASSQPLYVVDGVPMIAGNYGASGFADGTNSLSLINPADIESIEVLKDASAAAIYGSRSANGVVLITTKSGVEGKSEINVGYYAGVTDVTHRLDLLSGSEYLRMAKMAWANTPGKDTSNDYQAFYAALPFGITRGMADSTNTDRLDEMLRLGAVQEANFNIRGGNQKTTYYVGLTYRDDKGVIINNAFTRASGHIDLLHKATDKFTVGAKMIWTNTMNHRVQTGWAGGLGTAQSRSLPIMPVRNADGTFFAARSGTNPIAYENNTEYVQDATSIMANIFGDYKFTKWLKFRTEYALTDMFQRESRWIGTITQETDWAQDRRVNVNNWYTNNYLSFDKTFSDVHAVTAMIGTSAEKSYQRDAEFSAEELANPTLHNPGSGTKKAGTAYEGGFSFLSYFFRTNYAYNDKYLLSMSIRRDGSSRFGPDNRFGWFPAASVGWIISDESFMKGVPVSSFLKLRGSVGMTGNASIGNYSYFGSYYSTQYNGESGIGTGNIANPDLGWEKVSQIDFGLDWGILGGRISGGFDWYKKLTTDMLLNVNIPETSGSSTVTRNVGSMLNRGIEFFITSNNLTGALIWKTELNLARNYNEILDINNQIIAGETYGNNFAQEGYPIGAWRLVQWAGIDPLTGDELFINQETGEKTNEYNYARDAIVTGNPYPTFFGGMNNILSWKNFDMNIMFTWAVGQDVYRDDAKFLEGGFDGNWNQTTKVLDAWTPENTNTDVQRLTWQPDNRNYNTTRYLEDASYLRLKDLTIGYNLPASFTSKIKVKNVRVYFKGQNIWTLTNFTGWDPEVNRDASGNTTQGVTYLSPPQIKTIMFGINLTI
ncbi:MAG: TonB-dependent receptor [Bacteroidales bacterium]|nr:TonB-dependent receptor [Bacteroidales bacterium]